LSVDPDHPAGSSPYAYCSNQPTRYTDPTGARAEYPLDLYDREIAVRRYLDTRIPPPGLPNIGILHPGFWVGGGNPTLLDLLGGVVSFAGKVLKETLRSSWIASSYLSSYRLTEFGFIIGLLSFDLPRWHKGVFIFESKRGFAWLMSHNPVFKAGAITMSPLIIIAYADEGKIRKSTLTHEMVHIQQYRNLGLFSSSLLHLYVGAGIVNIAFHIWQPVPYYRRKRNLIPSWKYWGYYGNPFEVPAFWKEYYGDQG